MISKTKLQVLDNTYFNYPESTGLFFRYNIEKHTANIVYGCRESFGKRFVPSNELIGFFSLKSDIKQAEKFWANVYIRLGLRRENQLTFYRTNKRGCYIIRIPSFWRMNKFRREVLTLFLRCSMIYYHGNFLRSFRYYNLIKAIRPTIDAFLDGFTIPRYSQVASFGIVNEFTGRPLKQVGYFIKRA